MRFLSVAACDGRNIPVLDLMGRIERDQRWALGTIAGTRFKGGWGPSPAERYVTGQMGLITTSTGTTAVAIVAEPYSGSFADGIGALNQIAEWLSDHIVMLPRGRCPPLTARMCGETNPFARDPGDTSYEYVAPGGPVTDSSTWGPIPTTCRHRHSGPKLVGHRNRDGGDTGSVRPSGPR